MHSSWPAVTESGRRAEHAAGPNRKSGEASLPHRLRPVCKPMCGLGLKVRLRLTDVAPSQFIVDARRKGSESRA